MQSHTQPSCPASHLAISTHAALPLVLEQVLTHPERYRFAIDRKDRSRTGRSNSKSEEKRESPSTVIAATTNTTAISAGSLASPATVDTADLLQQGDTFKEAVMQRIAMSPTQPARLPPSYVMDFVRDVFTEDLCLVDFTQALTGLEYLKELESRRKREMKAALERLGIEPTMLEREKEILKVTRPKVGDWVAGIVDKAKRIDSLYTQVYIGLRRWTLINEMRLEPFNKANCIAMLNKLYPASYSAPPTSQLTPMLLNTQRNAFFRYILAVESNGKEVLQKLEQQGRRPADANAWPIVRIIVDKYLRSANNLIQDCTSVTDESDIESGAAAERRTDSGVSFTADKTIVRGPESDIHPAHRRPSTTQASYLDVAPLALSTREGSSSRQHHRHTSSDESIAIVRPDTLRHKEVRKVGSTLERLARELKRMRSRSNEGRNDAGAYADRPRSRSRGPSDASQGSGGSGSAATADDEFGDPFTVDAAPLPVPPATASTANFPDFSVDNESDHIMPLPTQIRSRGLKKMRSAGNIAPTASPSVTNATMPSRDNMVTGLKQGLSMERKASAPALVAEEPSFIQLHTANPAGRKFSVPTITTSGFAVSEEQRRNLIARARAEKENMSPIAAERRHSPIQSRVEALLHGGYGSSPNLSAMNLDVLSDMPVRRSSPGRNKLRDFYGVPSYDVPTSFAH